MNYTMLAALLIFGVLPLSANPSALEGYVVRTDSGKVFLDLGSSSGISIGDRFSVFKEGENLTHPVSGESLGPVINTVASGTIVEIQDKYSIGTVGEEHPELTPGLKVRISRSAPPALTAPAASAGTTPAAGRHPASKAPLLDLEAVDIAAADADGDGELDVVLADKKTVKVYPYRPGAPQWTPSCEYESQATGTRFLSVEAMDLDGDGRAEIFATLYSGLLKQVETIILDCAGGKTTPRATLPGMVRSYQTPEGGRALAMQELTSDATFPASKVYSLEYADGKYQRSRLSLKQSRLEWAYGFGLAKIGDSRVLVNYNHVDRLRIRFRKGVWTSPDPFGQTAERLEWQGKSLKFHPNIILENGPEEFTGLYTVKNIPRFVSLASAFGLFNRSELHHLRWNGMSLDPDWQAELGGYAAGLAEIPPAPGRSAGLLVAVVGANGRSSVWTFDR